MSGLAPDELLTRIAMAVGADPNDIAELSPSPNGTTHTDKGNVRPLPDGTPIVLRHEIERATDRSRSVHVFIFKAVALGLDDAKIVELVKQYGPAVDKYGARLENETLRCVGKLRAFVAANPDSVNGVRNEEAAHGAAGDSWQPVDLGPVLKGKSVQPMPSIMRRGDGACLLYSGMINGFHGPSGEGKGLVTCWTIAQQMRDGKIVLLLDFEDTAESIVARLRMFGATDDEIRDRFVYIRPSDPFNDDAVTAVIALALERHVGLVVIDSLGEAFGLDGINEDKDAEVGPWLRRVARRIADAGPAVLLIDHSTKAADNPLFPSGSKRKRAAIGGASYLITATAPLVKGKGGRLILTCAKDRHGNYARGEVVAAFVMNVDEAGEVRADLYSPDNRERDPLVEVVARAAVRAAKAEGRPMSLRTLLAAMKVKAGSDLKRGAIDLAVGRGALTETTGARNARLFTYCTDMPEATNDDRA